MAGIYLHIPFCKTRCIYCDFYSTTRSELITRYIHALCNELEMRKEYLKEEKIETVYFGGGTPSQLGEEDFQQIFKAIQKHYGLEDCREITLEANPDDLSKEYLQMLSALPFNRISMGIQTFDDATLKLLKRRHNARTATEAVRRCREAGYQNISIDLIYGLPGETKERWEKDLRQAISLNVEHISAYHLIYEEDTPIYNMLKQHQICEVDRISMGIQTFDDATLKLLKRRHNARTATEAVRRCREAGYQNISIDLIYGLPGETKERWEKDLRQAISLNVEHISAYHLIYEEDTPIYNMLKQHQICEVDEDSSLEFFTLLIEYLQKAGYEHYEISNFCRPGYYSRHNTSYWKGIPYLGCGPSAHSFNGTTREWNISSIDRYIKGIEEGQRVFETEYLGPTTRYNEFIITTMRTVWGTPIEKLKQLFGIEMWEYCRKMATPYLKSGKLEEYEGALRLTREGIFISDSIMSDLLWVD